MSENSMDVSQKILSDITVFNKYARFRNDLGRREVWDEICDRYEQMMIGQYPFLEDEIKEKVNFVRKKEILPSMRGLQFAGDSVLKNNSRIYNCSYLPIDDIRAFSEIMFLLLSGVGVGYSVQYHHIDKLPEIRKPLRKRKFLVGDNIEGWGDAIKVLMKSYFEGRSLPDFDYSDIRPKGSRLVTSGGKAPGPEPLKECVFQIKKILDRKEDGDKLKPIEAHDIVCYIADCVLSGGVRRSACISLFSFDDEEMRTCKFGNWWETNPQRARANNSAATVRHKVNKDQFFELWDRVKNSGSGEPGIYFTNDENWGTNPCCFVGDTKILTHSGYKSIEDCGGEELFINKNGEIVNGTTWSNGIKNVIELNLSNGTKIKCTPDHRFMTNQFIQQEAQFLKGERLMPYFKINHEISEFTKYGFIQGDGALGRLNSYDHKGMEIHIGEDDDDIHNLFGISKEEGKIKYYVNGYNEILRSLKFHASELPKRNLPDTYSYWDKKDKLMFLKGMYSANGSIIKGERVSYKTTCRELVYELLDTLSKFGISSYITTNKEKEVEFLNGNYMCKESYDVNISRYNSIIKFAELIGFVHEYKQESLKELILNKAPKVLNIKESGQEEVFDFSLEDDIHWGVVEGVIAHNCEIGLRPYQFCVGGDTNLITKDGLTTIKDAVGKDIEIWNGEEWSMVNPYKTGDNDRLHRVYLSDGSYLDATDNHKFLVKNRFEIEFREVELIDLIEELENSKYGLQVPRSNINYSEDIGMDNDSAYEYGFFIGDGHLSTHSFKPYANLYNEDKLIDFKGRLLENTYFNYNGTPYKTIEFTTLDKELCKDMKSLDGLPNEIFSWNKKSILNFIAGWADADGSQESKGIRIYGNYKNLSSTQLLLSKVGINSSLNIMSKVGDITNLCERKNDVWYLQITKTIDIPCQRLVCDNVDDVKNKGKYQIIKDIVELDGKHESYCLTENKLHQCVFNNILTKQCNLVEINASDVDTQDKLNERAKAASYLATLQASFTNFHYLRDIWKKTTEKEALIGVGITGIGSGKILDKDLGTGAELVKDVNAYVADKIHINKSARCTTVKPAGTSSIVLGTSSGIHAYHAKYYLRTLRINKDEPLYAYLVINHPELIEDEIFKPNTTAVIRVPQKAPEDSILRDESVFDLLERVKKFNLEWVRNGHRKGANTNNVSATISIKDGKWDDVAQWMWKNKNNFNGLSVLPYDGGTYKQAPFEDIDENYYNDLINILEDVDLTKVEEGQDNTTLTDELACSGGSCEIT